MTGFFEHYFLLPIRWFKINHVARKQQQQRCKVCGCRDKFDFNVPDELWEQVVPKKFQNRVVCLACFDDFAKKKGVDYSTAIKQLCFAGKQAVFLFNVKEL